MSYHVKEIKRGVYGELSKIREEVDELEDADEQGANIMVLNELSDIIGAIEGFLDRHYPSVTLQDLIVMKNLTKRAFEAGSRKAKDV